ncbi:hypothetical protein [Marinibactrum halimedae]|uniref:DUF4410 domain-containing protein n=1 Tax=Marinibactrum halimedae TaxID=1444977 RepID=A0AA37WMZ9_9GAMM|nr:hypothetical protein [Marinibactrum halimedae]MCD9461095.1 hypothetical protein [Marinibactrum halimedae]GLS25746.1 hypothetical protein GCM10007877_14600 [Marinibactrum halimedae]
MKTYLKTVIMAVSVLFLASCATQIVETPSRVTPATVKLSTFKKVVLVDAELAPNYAGQGANEKAAKKINEHLQMKLSGIFSDLEVVSVEESKAKSYTQYSNNEVLVIKPYIKQIKFIGGAARFWAGAMAGSSVVIMDTAFLDGASKNQLSNPGFERSAGAYTDAFGIASNRMLEDVAYDVVNYVNSNM